MSRYKNQRTARAGETVIANLNGRIVSGVTHNVDGNNAQMSLLLPGLVYCVAVELDQCYHVEDAWHVMEKNL